MKFCKRCGEESSLSNYRIRTVGNKDYLGHICKACERKDQKLKTSESWERYFTRLLSKRGRKETLSVAELVELYKKQRGLCALTGVPLTKVHGVGRLNTNASIDRIECGGTYTIDNVRLVCTIVNKMRLDNTDEELKFWCSQILNYDKTNA